jgi:O-methyltransferase involved in polyketide biosynthesis
MKIIGESFAGVATSATRVIELYYPEDKRLFDDQFALKLLPFGWRVFLRLAYLPGLRSAVLSLRERRMPGTLGTLLCRTRYIDDVLKRSLGSAWGKDARPVMLSLARLNCVVKGYHSTIPQRG